MALGKKRMSLEVAFAEKALELKRRAEQAEFERLQQQQIVDVSSHELRNVSLHLRPSWKLVVEADLSRVF